MRKVKMLVLVLSLLMGASMLHAQKTKLKVAGATMANDSAAKANAAARGGALMKASRDSLNASNLNPPRDVVDTFAVLKSRNPSLSKLTRAQIDEAFARIEAAKKLLDLAEQRLAEATASHSFSDEALLEASAKLSGERQRLEILKSHFEEVQTKWEAERELNPTSPTSSADPDGAEIPSDGN